MPVPEVAPPSMYGESNEMKGFFVVRPAAQGRSRRLHIVPTLSRLPAQCVGADKLSRHTPTFSRAAQNSVWLTIMIGTVLVAALRINFCACRPKDTVRGSHAAH